jgi:hypothetical protein
MASPIVTITLTNAQLLSIIDSAVTQALARHDINSRKRNREEDEKKDKGKARAEHDVIEVEDEEEGGDPTGKSQRRADPDEGVLIVAPGAQPVANKQECIICLDGDAQIRFRGCKHCVACCKCFIDKDGGARLASCPVCRTKVVDMEASPPFTIDGLVHDHVMSELGAQHNERLVRAMEFIVRGSVGAIQLCRKAMTHYSESAESSGFPMLSVDQAESLITAAGKRVGHDEFVYYVHHLFVCMCVHPWNVDKKVGRSGLCYYGNFGQKPFLREGIAMVVMNRSMLMKASLITIERSPSIVID